MRKTAVYLMLIALFWYDPLVARGKHRARRAMTMRATAFARARHATAAGTDAHEGIVAADPLVLPLGTRIRVTGTDGYDGDYLVTDTGAAVKGRHIDIYLASAAEARRFGSKTVRVKIRELGTGKADARSKDEASLPDAALPIRR